MSRRLKKVLTLSGSGAAGDVSAVLPMGDDIIGYNWVNTDLTSPGFTDITQIKENLNSDPVRLITGTDQNKMNLFDGMATFVPAALPSANNCLRIPNELLRMKDAATSYSTTRNTLSPDPDTGLAISSADITITQTSAKAWALFLEVDDATKGGPGGITRFVRQSVSVPGGLTSFPNPLPVSKPTNRFFMRLFFSLSAGNFNDLTVGVLRILLGSKEMVPYSYKTLIDQLMGDYGVRTPLSTTSTELDFDTTYTGIPETIDTMIAVPSAKTPGDVAGSFKMGPDIVIPNTFAIEFKPSAAATLSYLFQTIGRLG